MRVLTSHEIDLIAGGWGSSTLQFPSNDDDEIIVRGPRIGGPIAGPDFGGGYPGDPSDLGSGNGGDPNSGGGESSNPVARHEKTCGTESGAAVQIANHIKGVGESRPLFYNQGNWTKWEFTAVVTQIEEGVFGALNAMIYSNASETFAVTPSAVGSQAVGMIHNHPDGYGGPASDLDNRYPSSRDWAGLEQLAKQSGNANPSLWIIDYEGTVREFKMSERAYFEGLSAADRQSGIALEGRERTQSCG